MLQTLREKAQGWIAWVIVVLIASTFILFWGSGSFFSNEVATNAVVATVNGEKITRQALDSQFEKSLQQSEQPLSEIDPAAAKKSLLENIIRERVLVQSAQKMGFTVSPHRIELFIVQSPLFHKDGQFSKDLYRSFLYNMGITDKGFREILESQLVQQQLYAGLMSTTIVVEPEIQSFLKFYTQKRSFQYATVARKPFEDSVTITDDEIEKYYNANQKQFYTAEKVAIEYVKLSAEHIKQQFEPTQTQLKTYYNENVHLFNDPERRLLAHILIQVPQNASEEDKRNAQHKVEQVQEKLAKGESFDVLVKTYSDDNGTKDENGKLDWIVKGELGIPVFENAAFALKQGEVSAPIQTEFGYHFIKLLDLEAEKKYTYEQVADKVTQAVKQAYADEEIINLADRMANLAYDHPDTLEPIAEKLSIEIARTELFDRQSGPKQDDIRAPSVIEAAFSDYVKLEKNNSDLIQVNDKDYIILRVTETEHASLKPLEQVTADIKALLVFERSNELAKEKAEALKQAVISGDQDAMKSATWIENVDVSRMDTKLDHYLLTRVFELPRIQAEQTSIDIMQLENSDYAVIWLKNISEGSVSDLANVSQEQLKAHLERQWGELEYALFAKDRYQHAVIKHKNAID